VLTLTAPLVASQPDGVPCTATIKDAPGLTGRPRRESGDPHYLVYHANINHPSSSLACVRATWSPACRMM
jgi:hypothetical protein